LPKALTAIIVGAGLSVAGLQMQTFFRNPLASPDVLGISSGASLGVAILVLAGNYFTTLWQLGNYGTVSFATAGAFLAVIFVLLITTQIRQTTTLLIIGLMMSSFTSALVNFLQYWSSAEQLQTYLIWTMGSVGNVTWDKLPLLYSLVSLGILIAFSQHKALDIWLLGEKYSISMGISISKVRFWLILSTSLLTGVITAFCGLIGFIGMTVPHLCKQLLPTSQHRWLLPFACISGSCITLFCDILCHLPSQAQVLPLNIITSLFGAPMVIFLILKNRNIT
jgi:iron complex transport system permease protein